MSIGHRTLLKRWAAIICTALVFTHSAIFAEDDRTVEFDIDAQELGDALTEFGIQSGQEVYFVSAEVADIQTDGLEGVFTTTDAISRLLDDSGVDYVVDDNGTLLVGTAYAAGAGGGGDSGLGNSRTASNLVLMAQNRASVEQEQSRSGQETSGNRKEEEETELEEIVVTGTNIRGVAPDSSPSFTFDKEDIAKTGVSTLSEFMQTLPQTFGGGAQADVQFQSNDRSTPANLGNGSTVNLRGLGADGTLVLLNGRRLAASGRLGSFTDISMIPLSAIERIEVLTDGASAIYGADAIGGVVNIVLRSDYVGAESFGQIGTVTEGDLMEYRAGQTVGKAWGSGNVLASYEFYHRDNLSVLDREFSSGVLAPNNLLQEQQSHNVLLSASQELNDRITLRGEANYALRDVDGVNTGAPGRTNFSVFENEQIGGAIGAEIGLWADWRLDLSGNYSKVSFFSDITGFNSLQQETKSELWSVDGKADGTLFTLPGGDAKIATGLSYREEMFSFSRPAGTATTQDSRDYLSIFGEAYVPIVGAANRRPGVERLELTVAVRYDDYSDFGDTLNPKVGLLWSPVEGLRLRGTYSTSFNPPNLGDTGQIGGSALVFNVSNPASSTGTSLAIIDRLTPDLQPENSTAWTVGVDYSQIVGPGEFDLAVSWFDISYTDRIGFAGSPFSFLNDPITFAELITADPDPAVTAAIIADADIFRDLSGGAWTMPGDEEFILNGRLLNLANTDTSGLDVDINYDVDTDIGQLDFGLNSSYIFNQEKNITPTSPVFDVVDTAFNPADWRIRGSASWSNNSWSASAFVNYVDGYVDDRNLLGTGDVPVDSWTTVDVNLSYDTGDRSGRNFTDNIRLSLSVQNLFDQAPPTIESGTFFSGSGTGFDPTNADPLGRFVSFRVTKAW